jgi:hypothetical protein
MESLHLLNWLFARGVLSKLSHGCEDDIHTKLKSALS